MSKTRKVTASVVVAAIACAASAAPAFSDPGARASCMGIEASSLSPPGSSDEVPGGMPEFRRFIRETFPGTPPGVVSRTIAQLHEGSHEACDEAIQ
jgi:hypothetical protein